MKSKAVWFFPEFKDKGFLPTISGLINEATVTAEKIGGQAVACLIGFQVEKNIQQVAQSGVHSVYIVDNEIYAQYSLEAYTHAISELIKKHKPSVLLFESSPVGNELAARIAARLKCNCVIQSNSIESLDKNFCVTKSGYNGRVAIQQYFTMEQPLILTKCCEIKDSLYPVEPEQIQHIKGDIDSHTSKIRTKRTGYVKGDPKTLKLEESDRVVSVGIGLDKGHMNVVQKLADLLGATVGGTRPAVDDAMIPFARQIGITGKTISPELILNFALSGAREYTSGIERSSLNIAVNKDSNAPIFKLADVRAIGDANAIIENIVTQLEKTKK